MEHDNFRAALDWSQEGDHLVAGLRLAGALEHFWFRRDYQSEGVERLLDIISRSENARQTPENMRARAKALNTAGFLLWWPLDRHTEARPLLEEALVIGRRLGDKQTMARSLSWLGGVLIRQGDYVAARALVEQSLVLWRELENKREIGVAVLFFGDIALHQEEYEQAQLFYEESLALEIEIGDLNSQTYLCRRLGYLALRQNDSHKASELFKRGLEITRDGGDRQGIARYLGAFAAVSAMRGQMLRAIQLFGAAQAQLETNRAQLFSADRIEHERRLATLSSQLNEATFSAAWAEGRALTLEQAIALALEEPQG